MSSIFDVILLDTAGDAWAVSLPNIRGEGRERHVATRDNNRLQKFCKKYDESGFGVFFSVSTIAPGQPRKKENAVALKILFADIDCKDHDLAPEEIEQRLRDLPLPPSRIHNSGNGFHALWTLEQPVLQDGMEHAEDLLRGLSSHLGGDPSVAHRVALLRAPGTHNSKRGDWRLATVLKEGRETYTLDQIDAWLAAARGPVMVRRGKESNPFLDAAGKQSSFKPPLDVKARLAAMRHEGVGDTGIHSTQLSVSASLMSGGVDIDEAVAMILDATRAVGQESWNWRIEERTIRGMCRDWLKKHPGATPVGTVTLKSASSNRSEGVGLDDFRAYMPSHNYIFTPSREPWPASSVDARLGKVSAVGKDGKPVHDEKGKQKKINASTWLDQNRSVEQMTWAPGLPMLIADRLVSDGGFIDRIGVTVLNLYKPPTIVPGDGSLAQPWLEHVRRVYPHSADHIFMWLAHRVQRPG